MSTSDRPHIDHYSNIPEGETPLSSTTSQLSDEQWRARARNIDQRMRALQQDMDDLGIAPERAPSTANFGGETTGTSAPNFPTISRGRQDREPDEPPPSYNMIGMLE